MNLLRVTMTETGILLVMDEGEPVAIEAEDAIDLAKYIITNTTELNRIRGKGLHTGMSRFLENREA